ncbi:MAG: hypothetical protein HQ498_08635 [Pseudohongiella sp.]|nr:hypothetical protein [Pseudohongiella sp.]
MKSTLATGLILFVLTLSLGIPRLAIADEAIAPPSLIGTWEGPLILSSDENMKLALTFSLNEGKYTAVLISSGMGIYAMPADVVRVRGLNLTIRLQRLDLEILGTLRLDDSGGKIQRIDGSWFQGSEMVPLVLQSVDSPSC